MRRGWLEVTRLRKSGRIVYRNKSLATSHIQRTSGRSANHLPVRRSRDPAAFDMQSPIEIEIEIRLHLDTGDGATGVGGAA